MRRFLSCLGIAAAASLSACAEPVASTSRASLPAIQSEGPPHLIFFDWDSADLTDRARGLIAINARAALRSGSHRIEVGGHTDRSGAPQHNLRLSQRRAEAVAVEMTRQGIPRDELVIRAFGESRPLVPTHDGVHEPQNRRVEIIQR